MRRLEPVLGMFEFEHAEWFYGGFVEWSDGMKGAIVFLGFTNFSVDMARTFKSFENITQ